MGMGRNSGEGLGRDRVKSPISNPRNPYPKLSTHYLEKTMIIDHNQLQKILPHAYPFLLIDRVLEYKKGESLLAIKNITADEWPFNDFAFKTSVFPETLLIEAAAQAALVLYHVSKVKEGEPRPKYMLGRTKGEFEKRIIIGDVIFFRVTAKILSWGGYNVIQISGAKENVAIIQIIYRVVR